MGEIWSCISTIRNELVKRRTFATRDQARLAALFRDVEAFSNPLRRHSGLGIKPGGVRTPILGGRCGGALQRCQLKRGSGPRPLRGRVRVRTAGVQPLVLGGEVDVVGAGRGQRRFGERGVEPLGAVAGRAEAASAGGAVVAGALSGPAGEMLAGGKRLMSVPISASTTSAVRRCTPGIVQSSSTAAPEGQLLLDRVESNPICSSRKSRWARIAETSSACWASRSDPRAPLERRDLRPQPATGELAQHLRVGRAGDERLQHRPARVAEDVGGDAVELVPVSSRILCSRFASRCRSPICALR